MKIPKQAKRIFKGKIFDVYQWRQKMFDGSYKTFEMLKRPNTVQVIAVARNKILIAKQRQPQYKKYFCSLLGGRMNKGETPLAAAKRELMEEAGYESNDWELLSTKGLYHKIDWTMYNFIARNSKKTKKQTLDSGEKIKVISLNFEEFIEMLMNENFHSKDITLDALKWIHEGKLNQFKKKLFTCPRQRPRR